MPYILIYTANPRPAEQVYLQRMRDMNDELKVALGERLRVLREQTDSMADEQRSILLQYLHKSRQALLVKLFPDGDQWTWRALVELPDHSCLQVGLVRLAAGRFDARLDDFVVFTPFQGLGVEKAVLKAVTETTEDFGLRWVTWRFDIEDQPIRHDLKTMFLAAGFAFDGNFATLDLRQIQ